MFDAGPAADNAGEAPPTSTCAPGSAAQAHIRALTRRATRVAAQISVLQAELADLAGQLDDAKGALGGMTPAAHLALNCRLQPAEARRTVALGTRLRELPRVRAAFEQGRLSEATTVAIARVATAANEQKILDTAHDATAGQLQTLLRAYQSARPDPHAARTRDPEPYLRYGLRDDGLWHAAMGLRPEHGAVAEAALRAAMDDLARLRNKTDVGSPRREPEGSDRPDAPAHPPADGAGTEAAAGSIARPGAANTNPGRATPTAPTAHGRRGASGPPPRTGSPETTAGPRARGDATHTDATHTDAASGPEPNVGAPAPGPAAAEHPGPASRGRDHRPGHDGDDADQPTDPTEPAGAGAGPPAQRPPPVSGIEGFLHLVDRYLAGHSRADGSLPERYLVMIQVDADALASGVAVDDQCFIHGGGPLDPGALRGLVDHALVSYIVTQRGQPVTVTSPAPFATLAQRLALLCRDRGCRLVGCDRVHSLHAHHIHFREHGGPTNLANLVFGCGGDHRLVHRPGWKLIGDPTAPPGHPDRVRLIDPQGNVVPSDALRPLGDLGDLRFGLPRTNGTDRTPSTYDHLTADGASDIIAWWQHDPDPDDPVVADPHVGDPDRATPTGS